MFSCFTFQGHRVITTAVIYLALDFQFKISPIWYLCPKTNFKTEQNKLLNYSSKSLHSPKVVVSLTRYKMFFSRLSYSLASFFPILLRATQCLTLILYLFLMELFLLRLPLHHLYLN